MQFDHLEIVGIAIEAGQAIMDVYNSSDQIEVQSKEDESPLTKADIAAHDTIIRGLEAIDPEVPVVSEEGRVGDPNQSELSWLVDPLDGTKEFIKRNGMFTVNIALMKRDGPLWKPIFGVVHAPANGTTWFGGIDVPATRKTDAETSEISVNEQTNTQTRLVASGSHRAERDERFAKEIGEHELVRMGSSLKACIVAEGSADLYPRFGPTSCWDIAAAHAVVEAAGGFVLSPECETMVYDLVDEVLNPYFLVACSTKWNDIWAQNQD
tara:strand:+ start:873 stop:1673 length:801 start_codon:yes stop_codon:yes gene_type:complete